MLSKLRKKFDRSARGHGGAFGTQNLFWVFPDYNMGISVITNRDGAIASSINLFQLYVSEFPNSANSYDSLAEAYFNNKEYALSK